MFFLNVFTKKKTHLYQTSFVISFFWGQKGETSLCCACKRGDFEMAQFLINKGANINFSLKRGVFYSPTPIVIFFSFSTFKVFEKRNMFKYFHLFLVGLEPFMYCSFGG